jgi:hypothetical protein
VSLVEGHLRRLFFDSATSTQTNFHLSSAINRREVIFRLNQVQCLISEGFGATDGLGATKMSGAVNMSLQSSGEARAA